MKRRVLLGALAIGALVPWPACAQRAAMPPVIGYLHTGSPGERRHQVEACRGLSEAGFVDGKDVFIEYRWAEGHPDRLPSLARELAQREVRVIVAIGGLRSGLAARDATRTIPIVFTGADDPVEIGLVKSLSRPGGNATGITSVAVALEAKRFEVLRDLMPRLSRVAYLVSPSSLAGETSIKSTEAAARAARVKLDVVSAGTVEELDAAFAAAKKSRAGAVLVASNVLFVTHRERIVSLAARHALPAVYPFREFPLAGGLMSYGPDLAETSRQAGRYAGRILKGAKPETLPVLQIEKFDLVVNLKTAKALGLKIPREFLARVDHVVE